MGTGGVGDIVGVVHGGHELAGRCCKVSWGSGVVGGVYSSSVDRSDNAELVPTYPLLVATVPVCMCAYMWTCGHFMVLMKHS